MEHFIVSLVNLIKGKRNVPIQSTGQLPQEAYERKIFISPEEKRQLDEQIAEEINLKFGNPGFQKER